MKLVALAVVTALGAGACGDDDGSVGGNAGITASTSEPADASVVPPRSSGHETGPTTSPPTSHWPVAPPPVVFGPDAVRRTPFTVCWSEPQPADPNEEYESYCADGAPEADPPIVEPVGGRIAFTFPLDDWEFSASYLGGSPVTVEPTGGTMWELVVPADSPGGTVIVSGFGPQGDVHVAISLPGDGSSEASATGADATVPLLDVSLPVLAPGQGSGYALAPGGRGLISVGIHCGVRVLDRPVNGRVWQTSEGVGVLDWVPAEWPIDSSRPDGPLLVEAHLSTDGDILTLSLDGRDVVYESTGTEYDIDQLCA